MFHPLIESRRHLHKLGFKYKYKYKYKYDYKYKYI